MPEVISISKKHIWAGVIVLVLIGGFLFVKDIPFGTIPPSGALTAPIPSSEITLETIQGETISLSQFKGDVVVLQAMASWCSSCRLQAQQLKPVYEKYKDDGLVVISMDIQPERSTLDQLKSFKENHGGDWYFGFYPELITQYNVRSLDSTIIVDRAGNIVYRDEIVTSTEQLDNTIGQIL